MIGIRRDSHENRLRLAFNGSVPVRLKVSAGVGGARLSLSGMKVSEMEFDAGVGGSQISSYEPNPVSCDHIRIRNGVGSVKGTGLGNLNFRQFQNRGFRTTNSNPATNNGLIFNGVNNSQSINTAAGLLLRHNDFMDAINTRFTLRWLYEIQESDTRDIFGQFLRVGDVTSGENATEVTAAPCPANTRTS